jgi:hypothetical protein
MTRLLNAANKFLRVVQTFGYPDCTLEEMAKDDLYQTVCRNALTPEIPDKFITEVIEFIKATYGGKS